VKKMIWIYRRDPVTSLDFHYIEREFMRLRDEGGGEKMLTDDMILEVLPEQGLEYGFIYFSPSKSICGIVKTESLKGVQNEVSRT
jgi:hypothetical protein